MTNKMVIGYKFAFILLLLSSCVEDIRNCDIGNVDNMIPDGKERMELRLVIPGGKQPVVRSIENGTTGENEVERLFMDVMNSGTVIASRSTADGALTLTPTDVDSVYTVSTLFDIGTLEAGYTLRVRANEDTPAIISGQPVSPFYMSGTGVIEDGINRNFKASVHLLRGVAKLRTAVRTTSFTVPQGLMIGDVKIQVVHAADRIRKYAPFSSHANEAVVENLPASSLNYPDYPEVSLYDILAHEQVEINGEAITFYPLFVYENYLEQEEEYDPAINVTSLKLTIPVTDGIASRVIERTIPVKAEDSYRMKRNHIYSVDVQVLSLDEVKVFTDMLDWEDVGVTGDIVGTDFYIDRAASKGITLIKDIVDPVKLVKVDCRTPGRLRIRALKPNKTDLMPITDLQLYCNGIAETDKLADNSGIYDLTAAQVMNFYCTTGSVPANYEGGFIEISSDNVHVEYIPVSSNMILQLHRDLYKFSGNGYGGNFKSVDNVIAEELPDGTKRVRFQPVPAWETAETVNDLCNAFKDAVNKQFMDILLLLPMFILDFLCIHPFNDGNGRMSRLLTLLILYKSEYYVGQYISIERLISDTKENYYEALQESSWEWHEGRNDYAPFVKYMLGVIVAAYREFADRVEILTDKTISKSDRIEDIIRNSYGRITKAEIAAQCPEISQTTIQRTLNELLKNNQIIKIGGGRYTSYVWNRENE